MDTLTILKFVILKSLTLGKYLKSSALGLNFLGFGPILGSKYGNMVLLSTLLNANVIWSTWVEEDERKISRLIKQKG